MIRSYNGSINRRLIRDLKRIGSISAENETNLFEHFDSAGEVSVWENVCPFTHCPDEMSTIVTLKSEEEIRDYLKKDLIKRVEGYLDNEKPEEDYLLTAIVAFIKENGIFPIDGAMKQLEKEAEAKRIASIPEVSSSPIKITMQDVIKEILELAEEIMELRREHNPDDILTPPEPYPQRLFLQADSFKGNVYYRRYYGTGTSKDYDCYFSTRNQYFNECIRMEYDYDNTPRATLVDFDGNDGKREISDDIITIHKEIGELAKKEGAEFISQIDYEELSAK